MKTFFNKEVNYSLKNSENYFKELKNEISDVIVKISELYLEYFKFITENIKMNNTDYFRFLTIRGLDTITNVFRNILFYTKNLDLTYFHCQKAFYFYVEFISQILEDEKLKLELSSRDAVTYVYKKTIYELNHKFKKKQEELTDYDDVKLEVIDIYINLYKTVLLKIIKNDILDKSNILRIEKFYNQLSNLKNKLYIKKISEIIDNLYYKLNDEKYFFDVCELLVKKIIKKPDLLNFNYINKFLSDDFSNKINESHTKFVAWFLC